MEINERAGGSRPPNKDLTTRVSLTRCAVKFDLDRARKYLTGVQNLAREARNSSDPRVIRGALALLGCQLPNITELGVRP